MATPESQRRTDSSVLDYSRRYLDACITIYSVGVDSTLPNVSLSGISVPIRGLNPDTVPSQLNRFLERAKVDEQTGQAAREEANEFLRGLFQAAVRRQAWDLALNALDESTQFGVSGMNPSELQEQVESISDQNLRRTLARKLLERDDMKTAFGKKKRRGSDINPLKEFLDRTAKS